MSNGESRRGFRGAELNPKHTVALAHAIGGFLVNFGAIELHVDSWLHALATDSVAAAEIHRLPLGRKLHAIKRFLDAGRLSEEFINDASQAWEEVARLAEIRNQVAHNPVFFGWRGEERDGPPDFSGVLDRRKGPTENAAHPGLIALAELEAAQNTTAAIAQRLFELADRIGAADAWPPDDPLPRKR